MDQETINFILLLTAGAFWSKYVIDIVRGKF